MQKIIFVNATACTSGGVLTILKQFIENIKKNDKQNLYYIFSTNEIESKSENIKIITNIKGKKHLDRIKWDIYGIRKWAINNNIKPSVIISLQNTGVFFPKIPQIIYIHQPLPFTKESYWSVFKKDERKLWFYKNLYKMWIKGTVKKNHNIIVQTEWMKKALIEEQYDEKRITISAPSVSFINVGEIEKIKTENSTKYLFYPASDYKYKNHIIIIRALSRLKEEDIESIKDIKVVFTLPKESVIYEQAKSYGVTENINFIGSISYEEVLRWYRSCHAVLFPSYVETFGLPLIEAMMFGKKLLVSKCNYSEEIVSDYNLATYVNHWDIKGWQGAIKQSFQLYLEECRVYENENGWSSMFGVIKRELKIDEEDNSENSIYN